MSGDDEERGKQMGDLSSFVKTTCRRLTGVLSILGWTEESVSENQPMLTCTFDRGHRIRRENLEEHLEKCQWKAEGYAADDLPLSELCLSTNAWSAVNFERDEASEICFTLASKAKLPNAPLPYSSDDHNKFKFITVVLGMCSILMASFSSSERKAFYDDAIANTVKPVIGDDIADMNRSAERNGDVPRTSLLELLAQERNLKRRRAKHRGVHTNKKSHIEILREVINQQMEMYRDYLADTSTKEEPDPSGGSKARLPDSYGTDDRKYSQHIAAEKYSTDHLQKGCGTSDHKHLVELNHARTIPPGSSLPANDTDSNRVRRRNRSGSANEDREREKHTRKRERDRSKDRKRHEDGRPRHRRRDEDLGAKAESRRSGDKYDRRKRRRSHDRNGKSVARSRRHEESGANYYRYQRQ